MGYAVQSCCVWERTNVRGDAEGAKAEEYPAAPVRLRCVMAAVSSCGVCGAAWADIVGDLEVVWCG